MSTLTVSSKGHITLPAALRRRLGLGVGAQLEVLEEADGLRLRVLQPVAMSDLSELAGMVKAPSRGATRRLEDFMNDHVLELAEMGKALAPEDRSRLVDMLLESLHEGSLGEVQAAWDEEVERRLAAYDRGEVQAIDGETVLARARDSNQL